MANWITPYRGRRHLVPDQIMKDFFGRNVIDDFFNGVTFNNINEGIKTDIKETETEYLVEAEIPGYKKEDISIDLDNDRLTIIAKHNEEVNEEKDNYIRRERRYGENIRSFIVNGIENENVTADYKDGILYLKLPKADKNKKNGRSIEIN